MLYIYESLCCQDLPIPVSNDKNKAVRKIKKPGENPGFTRRFPLVSPPCPLVSPWFPTFHTMKSANLSDSWQETLETWGFQQETRGNHWKPVVSWQETSWKPLKTARKPRGNHLKPVVSWQETSWKPLETCVFLTENLVETGGCQSGNHMVTWMETWDCQTGN